MSKVMIETREKREEIDVWLESWEKFENFCERKMEGKLNFVVLSLQIPSHWCFQT